MENCLLRIKLISLSFDMVGGNLFIEAGTSQAEADAAMKAFCSWTSPKHGF